MSEERGIGLLGVFATPQAIGAAAREFRGSGFRRLDAYTPYSVDGLDEIIHLKRREWLPAMIFAVASAGGLLGYFVQYWAEAVSYPLDVGGRPYNSWPAFAVSTFESIVLCAVAAGFAGLLAVCRLPLLYHPLFAASGFETASRDRFVLCIGADDPRFDRDDVRRILERCGAERVAEIPR